VPGIIKINKGGPVFKYCVLNFRVLIIIMPECCVPVKIFQTHKRAKRQKEEFVTY